MRLGKAALGWVEDADGNGDCRSPSGRERCGVVGGGGAGRGSWRVWAVVFAVCADGAWDFAGAGAGGGGGGFGAGRVCCGYSAGAYVAGCEVFWGMAGYGGAKPGE